MPGFSDLLNNIANQWSVNRSELLESADKIIEHLKNSQVVKSTARADNLINKAVQMFEETFDDVYGGFGSAPKFPTAHNLLFLILYAKSTSNLDTLKMPEKTLVQMRKGGIFDHIGYGFSIYSTDKYFLAPHFEKMLYDNALLIMAYSALYSVTDNNFYLDTAQKTAEYILGEMTSSNGSFYSAQDADSEGVEGKYYTFTQNEIIDVLGKERGAQFAQVFDITSDGNFEGVNIPNLLKSNNLNTDFEDEIKKLYSYRKSRTNLHLDDKVLTSWNCMMISAMCMLYRVSHDEKYLNSAKKAQRFIEKNLCKDLNIYTSYRDDKNSKYGFLDDYAFYIASLIELYNSTLDSSYLEKSEKFCDEAAYRFEDVKMADFIFVNLIMQSFL